MPVTSPALFNTFLVRWPRGAVPPLICSGDPTVGWARVAGEVRAGTCGDKGVRRAAARMSPTWSYAMCDDQTRPI
eukprot:2643175-Lingulodinium_polyedra.AAC.1